VQSVILFTYPLVLAANVMSLVLSAEAVRRIRRFSRTETEGAVSMPPSGPRVGAAVPEFYGLAIEGESVSSATFATGRSVVGFFGATCQPCREHLPAFLADLTGFAVEHGLVVVVGDRDAGSDLVALAVAAGRPVLAEPDNGAMSTAFDIRMFPTVVAVRDGAVVDVGQRLRRETIAAGTLATAP
jgi:hypothetical protein